MHVSGTFMTVNITGGCFTNVSRALQDNLAKIHVTNHVYGENFKLKMCMCAQSMALGTRTKFQLEILVRSMISAIHKIRENILESSRNVSETTPRFITPLWCDVQFPTVICVLIFPIRLKANTQILLQSGISSSFQLMSSDTVYVFISSPHNYCRIHYMSEKCFPVEICLYIHVSRLWIWLFLNSYVICKYRIWV